MTWYVTVGEQRLVAHPFRACRPITATKIYVDNRARTFALGKGGRLYASYVSGSRGLTVRNKESWPLVYAAIALGVLSKEAAEPILALAEKEEAARDAAFARNQLLIYASSAGIKFTPAQSRRLKLAAGGEKR